MATDVVPSRQNLFVEETNRNTSWSERLAQKNAGSINFINDFQYTEKTWNLNGNAAIFTTLTGIDGIYIAPFNLTIVGMQIYGTQWGTSGSTTIDFHKLSGGDTDDGTIWTTAPNILSSAATNTYSVYKFDSDGTVNVGNSLITTGFNTPELISTEIDKDEAIRFDPDTIAGGTENLSFQLIVRPR